eukprot:gene20472-38841_t
MTVFVRAGADTAAVDLRQCPRCSQLRQCPRCSQLRQCPRCSQLRQCPGCSQLRQCPRCSQLRQCPRCSQLRHSQTSARGRGRCSTRSRRRAAVRRRGRRRRHGGAVPTPSPRGPEWATTAGLGYTGGPWAGGRIDEQRRGTLDAVAALACGGAAWHREAPLRVPRHSLAAAACHGRVYAIGGCDRRGQLMQTVEAVDALDNPDSPPAHGPERRQTSLQVPERRAGWRSCDGLLYAIGGMQGSAGGYLGSVEVYDPATGR